MDKKPLLNVCMIGLGHSKGVVTLDDYVCLQRQSLVHSKGLLPDEQREPTEPALKKRKGPRKLIKFEDTLGAM